MFLDPNRRTGLSVNGHPAVVSDANGSNASISWELAPGVIAYISYSGLQLTDMAVTALVGLANQTHPLSSVEWTAINPQLDVVPG